jgi:hypothetical protein
MLRPYKFLSVTLLLVASALAGEMPFPQPEKGVVRLLTKDSPYILEQGVMFSSTDTFLVEPGVTVLMGEYAKIMLRGPVRIQGTPEKPITFRSADSSESWNGIHFVSSSKPFEVRNLVVENAFRNTVFRTDGIFDKVKFVNNYYGLWVDEVSQMYLTDCEFSRNRFALSLRAANVTANNTTVANNVYGLYLEAEAKYNGDMALVTNNLEADVRNESQELVDKGRRVSRNIWHRVEARF